MKPMIGGLLLMFSAACLAEGDGVPYVVMQDDLAALKHDFNEAVDQVRLVFIVGPT